jgi:hypothetical protein
LGSELAECLRPGGPSIFLTSGSTTSGKGINGNLWLGCFGCFLGVVTLSFNFEVYTLLSGSSYFGSGSKGVNYECYICAIDFNMEVG